MIQHPDIHNLSGLLQPSGNRKVRRARHRVAAGVVVEGDDRRCVIHQRGGKNLPRLDINLIETADAYYMNAINPPFGIEGDDTEF